MSDDYYELLGVDPGAGTDEIRDKYRQRRSDIDAKGTDASRSESAELNRAWNVLSDPYQRGRYDAARDSGGDGAVATDDIEIVDEPEFRAAPPRRRGLFGGAAQSRQSRAGATPPPPTIELPAGQHFAETRPRVTAMVIDVVMLAVLFVGVQVGVGALERHLHPREVKVAQVANDRLSVARQQATTADSAATKADTRLKDVQKSGPASQLAAARSAAEKADARKRTADSALTKAQDTYNKAERKFYNLRLGFMIGFFVVGWLLLTVPSALTGQTIGKRIRHVKVVRQDGSPLGWSGAIRRYGLLAAVTFALFVACLGPYAGLVVIAVLAGWMRNPNRQGLHDRLAKTVVIDAS
ncbi:MAG: DnaJ-like protein [Actinomycetia bacterium]|nr:DnaJ-like protein [Actinomycetes bacterium]